jgi:Flp pilus assembly protein TadG
MNRTMATTVQKKEESARARLRIFRRLTRLSERFARSTSGATAVEFAFILPLMLTLFFGALELTELLLADLKLTAAAQTAADLVAQQQQVAFSDITNITNAAEQVMTPLPGGKLQITYASILFNNGTPVIAWQDQRNGAPAITIPPNSNFQKLLESLGTGTDSVIVVQTQYAYASVLSYVLRRNWVLNEAAYDRPRTVVSVACNAC